VSYQPNFVTMNIPILFLRQQGLAITTVVGLSLEAGCEMDGWREPNEHNKSSTALQSACLGGHSGTAGLLLGRKANVNVALGKRTLLYTQLVQEVTLVQRRCFFRMELMWACCLTIPRQQNTTPRQVVTRRCSGLLNRLNSDVPGPNSWSYIKVIN
jgi:hypothetical protein